jgi:hypothetical protein
LVFSFFAFYKLSILGFSKSFNAWSGQKGALLFPLTTLVVLFGVIMAAHVAVTAFAANVNLPDRVLGLTWNQVHLALGFQATIMMITYLIRDKGGLTFGIGFWFMLIAAIALLVGAILRMREPAGSGSTPPSI